MVLKKKGFTVIEVMVSLLVFIIGIGIFSVSYINLVRQQLINQRLQATLGNFRLALEKIWREMKYGVNFTTSTNEITFKRVYDCGEVAISYNGSSLIYKLNGKPSNLTDPDLIKINSFEIYTTGNLFDDPNADYSQRSIKLITLAIRAEANMQNFYVPLNFQISVAPINSIFPSSPCP